jgi:predicted RecB family nuclease
LEAHCDVLLKIVNESSTDHSVFEPTIYSGSYRPSREEEFRLFFIGHVLRNIQGKYPIWGNIIDMGGIKHKIRLEKRSMSIELIVETLREWISNQPDELPVILNKHCSYCQFQALCKSKAEQEDHISLLDGLTPRMIQQYEKRGIFTVKQLSYLFKLRRHKRRSKRTMMYKPELQALAIRTGKIYLQSLPQISRQPIEIVIDIEGVQIDKFITL